MLSSFDSVSSRWLMSIFVERTPETNPLRFDRIVGFTVTQHVTASNV
jgi:hypothetical protein